jgi:hypothetical protein
MHDNLLLQEGDKATLETPERYGDKEGTAGESGWTSYMNCTASNSLGYGLSMVYDAKE